MSTGSRVKADPDAWIRVCDRLLDDEDYRFAHDTVEGIRDDIESKDRVTAKQINALLNIRRGGDRL